MDLQALPEGCIANVISLTTPLDAFMMSLVSKSFWSAAKSDAVWDRFLPPDINAVLSSSSLPGNRRPPDVSKKELYLSLYPVVSKQGKMCFSLDQWSGKKCYMIAARALSIHWGDDPAHWQLISHPDSRFEVAAELVSVCELEISGKIKARMLSPSTLYKTYLVFKSTEGAYGFEHDGEEATVGLIGKQRTKRKVSLAAPNERNDGWLEIELGEFFCEGGEVGKLEMACLETNGGQWKGGLIFQGIEIRPSRM